MLRYTAMAVLLLSVFSLSVARAQALERPTASLLASLPPAQLDARPSTGTGLIVAGWISTGVGAVNLAAIPVCFADFYPREAEDLCVGLSVAIGGVGLALGIPLLIAGYNQRAEYKDWKARQGLSQHLLRLSVAWRNDAGLLLYRGEL